MSDLVVGDHVYVIRKDEVITSPVLAIFRHHRNSIRFIDIYTAQTVSPLRLTPLHSLLVFSKHGKTQHYSYAQDILVDDFIFSSNLRLSKVTAIKEVLVDDDIVYAPLTLEGSIIVNDIVASCYGTLNHSIMHILTIPIRWWYFALFHFHQLTGFDHFQRMTSNFVVHVVDFYAQYLF